MKLFLFHTIALIHYVYSLWFDQMFVDIPSKVPEDKRIHFFKGRLIYLTLWNMLIQTFFYAVCLVNDVVGSNDPMPDKDRPAIRKFKDTLMTSVAYPLSMFVGVTFWALYAIDRELVFPKSIDPFFPSWLNHVMHTNIMVFILIEMYLTFRIYPKRSSGLKILISVMGVYLIWMHVVYLKTGVWVYPVMAVLNLPLRICFFFVLFAVATVLYLSGEMINSKIWNRQIKQYRSEKVK